MDSKKQAIANQCIIHDQEYVAIDMNPQSLRFLCLTCLISIEKKSSIKSLNDAQIYLQGIKDVFKQRQQEQSKKNSQILKDLTSSIQSQKIIYNQCLDKIIAIIQQQDAIILQEQEDLIIQLESLDLIIYLQSYQIPKSNEWKKILETQILNLNSQDLIHNCLQLLVSVDDPISFTKLIELDEEKQTIVNMNDITTKIDQVIVQQYVSLVDQPYEIMAENTKKQSDVCYAIAFNTLQTLMIAGLRDITVFEFKQGQLNQKQLLRDHNSSCSIRSLYFMKKENQFISGAYKEIGIWSYNISTQQYYCLQIIQAHSDSVNRVIMNENDDLMISCSSDDTIKFWIRRKEWECFQSLTNHKNGVLDISLNEACSQLVSCDRDGQIIISQQGEDQKWRKIQRIQSKMGYRICYINNNLIAFQPWNRRKLSIYKLNEQNKQFVKYRDVPVQKDSNCYYWFPMQFNNEKSLLLNKNGHRVNFIRYKNNAFIREQSINFGTEYVLGAMTNDFQYLVTYDFNSKEFQVRKQK